MIGDYSIEDMIADTDRFLAMAECERTCATNKFLVQVIDKKGKFHYAYFNPPEGMPPPEIVYENKLEALRACMDSVIKENES